MVEEDVKFIELSHGRQITYREKGLGKEMATKSLLVLHVLGSSCLLGMFGVFESLLTETGVRLVSVNKHGYIGSDFNAKQTFEIVAKDMVQIAYILELGKKIWLLGYSYGGAYYWAVVCYILERIAGIAMWALVGNYYWKVLDLVHLHALKGEEHLLAFCYNDKIHQETLVSLWRWRNYLRMGKADALDMEIVWLITD